jgi:excisionase family DNA binding protein
MPGKLQQRERLRGKPVVERSAVPIDAVFTIDELAIYLKLPKRTLYKLAQEGSVPGHKVGRHWRFRRATIDRWMDESWGGPA